MIERYGEDISSRMNTIQERVREVSSHVYREKSQELFSAPGVNRALPLLLMSDLIEKNAKMLDKRFPDPLLG